MQRTLMAILITLGAFSAASAQTTYPNKAQTLDYAFAWVSPAKNADEMPEVIPMDIVSAWQGSMKVGICEPYSMRYDDAIWCFSSKDNLITFAKSIDADNASEFEPFAGGYAALDLASGVAMRPGNPCTARVYTTVGRRRLILQRDQKDIAEFEKDLELNVRFARHMYNALFLAGNVTRPEPSEMNVNVAMAPATKEQLEAAPKNPCAQGAPTQAPKQPLKGKKK